MRPLEVRRTGTAKFDLTLAIEEPAASLARPPRVHHRPVRRRDRSSAWPATSGRCSRASPPTPTRRRPELPLLARRRAAAAARRRGTGTAAAAAPATPASTSSSRRRSRAHPGRRRRRRSRAKQLTYRELDARANRLGAAPAAPRRRARGAGRRSAWSARSSWSSALLGDPQGRRRLRAARSRATPRERLAFMLDDAGAAGRCSPTRRLRGPARRARGAAVVCARRDGAASPPGQARADPRAGGRAPDDLAYVIYTSGSTGRAQGRRWSTHRSAGAPLRAARRGYRLRPATTPGRCSTRAPSTSRSGRSVGALLDGGRAGGRAARRAARRGEFRGCWSSERVTVLSRPRPPSRGLRRGPGGDGRVARSRCATSSSAARRSTRALRPWSDDATTPATRAGQHVRHHRDDGARHLPSSRRGATAESGGVRSAGRSPTLRSTCSTRTGGRCRSGCRASCTSAARAWRAAT